jgi:hypothetical protein
MGDDQWAMTEPAPAAERGPEVSLSSAAAPADEVAAMLMRMSAPVEWEHALAHDRSKASPSSGGSGNNSILNAPLRNDKSLSYSFHEERSEPSELSGMDDGASSLMGVRDTFALLAGMDVEMDLVTMEAPRSNVLPLLDFSKLKGYESPPRGSTHRSGLGGGGGGGGGGEAAAAAAEKGLPASTMIHNAHHAFAGPGPSPHSALESNSHGGPDAALPPRAEGIGRGRPVLPTTPRKGQHHVASPRKPSMLCCFG